MLEQCPAAFLTTEPVLASGTHPLTEGAPAVCVPDQQHRLVAALQGVWPGGQSGRWGSGWDLRGAGMQQREVRQTWGQQISLHARREGSVETSTWGGGWGGVG